MVAVAVSTAVTPLGQCRETGLRHLTESDASILLYSPLRYAIKVMSEVEAWDLLLEVFASRTQTSDYMPADEVAYTRFVRGLC